MELFSKQTFLGLDVTPRWVLRTELESLRRQREEHLREITRLECRTASLAVDCNAAEVRIRGLEEALAVARDKISKVGQPRFRGRFVHKEKPDGE